MLVENQDTQNTSSKPNILPALASFLAGGIIFGIVGYHLGNDKKPETPIQGTTLAAQTTSTVRPVHITPISQALGSSCTENKIRTLDLPYYLADNLKTEYSATDSIVCAKDVGYAYTEHNSDIPNIGGADKSLYFYDANLKTDGLDKTVKQLTNYTPVIIEEQSFAFELLEPAPYGINSRGVWINLITEKIEPTNGNIVQIVGLSLLTDQKSLDLVKKYGSETDSKEGDKIYVVKEEYKEQFKSEIVKLAPKNETLIVTAKEILEDLESVSF